MGMTWSAGVTSRQPRSSVGMSTPASSKVFRSMGGKVKCSHMPSGKANL